MSVITWGSTTIWAREDASGIFDIENISGLGWKFTRGFSKREKIIERLPLGDGFLVKDAGRSEAIHKLDLQYYTNDKTEIYDLFEYLDDGTAKELTIPTEGSFSYCFIDGSPQIEDTYCGGHLKSSKKYVVKVSISFRERPVC